MSVANPCQSSSSPEKEEATSVYVGHHLPNISDRLFLLFIWLIQLENSFIVTDAAIAESLINKALLFKSKGLNANGESDEEPADGPIKFKFTTTDNERETMINSKKDVLFMCLGGLNDFASNKAETLFYAISALVWFLREFQNNALFNYTFDFSSKELGFKHYVNGILTSFVPFDAECSTNHAADMLNASMEIKGFTSFAETFTNRCEITTTVHPRSAVAKKRIVYDDTITDFPSTTDVSNLNDGSIKRVKTLNERNALIASKKSIVFFTGFELMDKERSATSCFIECFQEHPNLIYCFDYTNPDSVSFDFYTHGSKVRQVNVTSPTTPYDRIKACVESAIKDVVNSILKHLGNGPYTIDGPVTVDASINGSDNLFEECKKLNEGGQITVKIHEDAVKLLECAKKYGHTETEKRLTEFIAVQFA